MQYESPAKRRPSTRIYVGDVPIGDGAPIAVQSMTNTGNHRCRGYRGTNPIT